MVCVADWSKNRCARWQWLEKIKPDVSRWSVWGARRSRSQSGAIEGNALFVATCANSRVSLLCISRIRAQLYYWLNLQSGKQQLCPPAWAESPGTRMGPSGWTVAALGWSGWRSWVHSYHLTYVHVCVCMCTCGECIFSFAICWCWGMWCCSSLASWADGSAMIYFPWTVFIKFYFQLQVDNQIYISIYLPNMCKTYI